MSNQRSCFDASHESAHTAGISCRLSHNENLYINCSKLSVKFVISGLSGGFVLVVVMYHMFYSVRFRVKIINFMDARILRMALLMRIYCKLLFTFDLLSL